MDFPIHNTTVFFNHTDTESRDMNVTGNKMAPFPDTAALEYKAVEAVLYQYVMPALCCFGIVGNILNLVILSRKSLTMNMERLEKCAHGHLIALAVSDLMYCITALPRAAKPAFVSTSYVSGWLLYETYHGAVVSTFMSSSSWLTVAMAVSRYIAICYPVKARQHLGITATRIGIFAIFILSILFNLPRYFILSIHHIPYKNGGNLYFTFSGPLRSIPHAEDIYLWLYFVLGIVLPLITVTYCNIYLIRALHASLSLRRQHARGSVTAPTLLTLTLSIIVVLYVVLVSPAETVLFFRSSAMRHLRGDALASYSLAMAVCNIMQTLNFAVNFLLYCLINVHFRNMIRDVVCGRRNGLAYGASGERSSMLTHNTATVTVNIKSFLSETQLNK
jgi:hypothetical protein